jgi:XTP/dITP diphosphohydrolase
MKRKILVATTNPGKIAELRAMLEFDVGWVGLADFPNINEVKEDGETFAENARKKAIGYAKKTGLWTIADDSGLVVDALGGEPGVKSARFADFLPQRYQDTKGKKVKDKPLTTRSDERQIIDRKNFEKVLKLLKNVPLEKRTARFVCCLCLASAEKILIETEGKLEGVIAEKEMGTNGFGYDPIFFVPKLNKTVAQLTREEKNAISHRGNAIRKLKPLLGELLETT